MPEKCKGIFSPKWSGMEQIVLGPFAEAGFQQLPFVWLLPTARTDDVLEGREGDTAQKGWGKWKEVLKLLAAAISHLKDLSSPIS